MSLLREFLPINANRELLNPSCKCCCLCLTLRWWIASNVTTYSICGKIERKYLDEEVLWETTTWTFSECLFTCSECVIGILDMFIYLEIVLVRRYIRRSHLFTRQPPICGLRYWEIWPSASVFYVNVDNNFYYHSSVFRSNCLLLYWTSSDRCIQRRFHQTLRVHRSCWFSVTNFIFPELISWRYQTKDGQLCLMCDWTVQS